MEIASCKTASSAFGRKNNLGVNCQVVMESHNLWFYMRLL